MGGELQQGGGEKRVRELACSWGPFSTLEMGGSQTSDRGKGK